MVLQNLDLNLRKYGDVRGSGMAVYPLYMDHGGIDADGGALLVLLPLDIYYSLLPMTLLEIGLGYADTPLSTAPPDASARNTHALHLHAKAG